MKIPNGWKKVQFGDVVSKINDKVSNREEWNFERYIGGEHFDEGEIRLTRSAPIEGNEEVIGSAFHMRFKPGQVLYVTRNPRLRKGGMVDFEGVCSNVSFVMEADETKLLQSLLPFVIQTEDFVKHTCNNAHGSTNPFLNWKDIAKYEFLLPPIEEQKKINELLWGIEENIKVQLQHQKYIEKLKKITMKDIFISGLKGSIMSNSKFEDICLESPRNGIYKSKEYHGKGIKMINMGEIFKYPIIENPPMELLQLDQSEMERFLVEDGDLVFARRSLVVAGAGKCCIIKGKEPRTFESSIIRVRLDKKKVDPKYLFYYFNSVIGRKKIERIVRHVAVAGITGTDLMKINIDLPSLEHQKKIIAKLELIDVELNILSQNYIITKKLRNKLFNELLKGELRLD